MKPMDTSLYLKTICKRETLTVTLGLLVKMNLVETITEKMAMTIFTEHKYLPMFARDKFTI